MKDDERELLKLLQRRGGRSLSFPTAWEFAESIGISYKRARYILRDKWPEKNWYEYGVSWRAGWLTTDGMTQERETK